MKYFKIIVLVTFFVSLLSCKKEEEKDYLKYSEVYTKDGFIDYTLNGISADSIVISNENFHNEICQKKYPGSWYTDATVVVGFSRSKDYSA